MNKDGAVFKFATGGELTFEYSARSSLPIVEAANMVDNTPTRYIFSTGRKNVSKAQEELLLWHSVLGHYNIANTQNLMSAKGLEEEPALISRVPGIGTCNIPLCPSCLAGKVRQITLHDKHITPTIEHSDVIKDGDLLPCAAISTDQ